jgi:hypothetical protein
MIFRLSMLDKGPAEVKMAGFYDNNWQLSLADLSQEN